MTIINQLLQFYLLICMTIQQSIFAIVLNTSASRACSPEKKLRLSEFMKFDENYDYRNIFNNI